MKARTFLRMIPLVLLCPVSVFAQDAVKADPEHYKVVFENPSVRILRITYAPGSKSKVHQHPDAIVVPLATSKMHFVMADGKSEDMEMATETAQFTPAVTHTPSNAGTVKMDALLIEFKTPAAGTATLPTTRPAMAMKVLAEGPRGAAYRNTAEPTFSEPAGSKHDYDQIVIALGPSPMSIAIDGKPAKTSWTRGDVQFIGRGVAHESKNGSGKPIDFIIVALK